MEAVYRFRGGIENLEETICRTQDRIVRYWNAGKLDVPIALDGFLQAVQQQVDHGIVQVLHIRTVEHKVRASYGHRAFDLASEVLRFLPRKSFRQLHHCYG